LDTSWAAAVFWAAVGGLEGTGAMTIPPGMTVVCFTLVQMGEVAAVAAPDLEDPPDMFIPAMDPLEEDDDDALVEGAFEEPSASDTAPSTSTAAVAIETAPIHHTLPAKPMAAHRWLARCLRSPMSTLPVVCLH